MFVQRLSKNVRCDIRRSNDGFEISVRFCASASRLIGLLSVLFVLIGSRAAYGAEMPLLRANYAAISGAFAPLWIATEKGL